MENAVHVYGTDWCGVTSALRRYLATSKIPCEYHNIEQDRLADEFVVTMNDGRRRFPLIVLEERILVSPTVVELQRALSAHGIR